MPYCCTVLLIQWSSQSALCPVLSWAHCFLWKEHIISLRTRIALLSIVATLSLAGCQSSEEKAEGYYQSGMTLLAAGDVDRALVEFRNVFKYNGFHKEARQAYANAQFDRGEVGEAYSQYLRLIEQYPDTVEVRQRLAEIAISRGDWAEVERHGQAALQLGPNLPGVQAIGAALAYRQALSQTRIRTRLPKPWSKPAKS